MVFLMSGKFLNSAPIRSKILSLTSTQIRTVALNMAVTTDHTPYSLSRLSTVSPLSLLRLKPNELLINSQFVNSQGIQCYCTIRTIRERCVGKVTVVYCENHREHKNTLCRRIAEFSALNLVVHTQRPLGFKGLNLRFQTPDLLGCHLSALNFNFHRSTSCHIV